MQTVQMTLDKALVAQVDRAVRKLGTSRSAFTRNALREALAHLREKELEKKHREGYERHPVETSEIAEWEAEQVWLD